jgi:hypothetical protein
MKKLVLAFATVAMLGLSTSAFAQNAGPSSHERVQPARSQAAAVHKTRLSHRTGTKKVVVAHHRGLHRHTLHSAHYAKDGGNKKSVAEHAVMKKTMRAKAFS